MDTAKVSAYTTCRNIVEMDYPFEAAVRSALSFADEVVIADSSDKDDGTMAVLEALMDEDARIQVYQVDVDWKAPNSGIMDGQTKAFSREQCTGDFLVSFDADEVFEDKFGEKLKDLIMKVNFLQDRNAPLLATPVVEYWGGKDKVRIDVNCWKERVSRRDAELTHGIPVSHRWYKDGLLYARQGTDGCNILDASGNPVPCIHFANKESEQARIAGIKDTNVASQYQFWLQAAVDQLPVVHHFSWWSIASKIKKYRGFWNRSWLSLYGEEQTKPEGWNPFFDKPLDQLSDKEIEAKAKELRDGTGGHIFHAPWDGSKTNAVSLKIELPEVIKKWTKKHKV